MLQHAQPPTGGVQKFPHRRSVGSLLRVRCLVGRADETFVVGGSSRKKIPVAVTPLCDTDWDSHADIQLPPPLPSPSPSPLPALLPALVISGGGEAFTLISGGRGVVETGRLEMHFPSSFRQADNRNLSASRSFLFLPIKKSASTH